MSSQDPSGDLLDLSKDTLGTASAAGMSSKKEVSPSGFCNTDEWLTVSIRR